MYIYSNGAWMAFISNSTISQHRFDAFQLKLNKLLNEIIWF